MNFDKWLESFGKIIILGNIEQTMTVPFIKMSAAGNDFILIDNRSGQFHIDWSEFARIYCRRRLSIGADGVLIIDRSKNADFSMLYFNADGSSGGMCGNGGRCAAAYFMSTSGGNSTSFEALDYIYHAYREKSDLFLRMKNPADLRLNITLYLQDQPIKIHYVNSGSPHVVLYLDSLGEINRREIEEKGIQSLGRTIRFDPMFQPEGTNVNFITISEDGVVNMRTYERGVEAETLACGTGAVACSVISAVVKMIPSPVRVRTRSNQILIVSYKRSGDQFNDIVLGGDVNVVYRGKIEHDERGSG